MRNNQSYIQKIIPNRCFIPLKYLPTTLFFLYTYGFSNLQAQFVSAEVAIDGFTCSMCALGVEKSILQLDFVAEMKMDLNTSTAKISFRKNKPVSIHKIADKILDAGFSVRYINAEFNFPKISIDNYSIFNDGDNEFHFMDVNPDTITGPITLVLLNQKLSSKKTYTRWQRWIKEDSKRNGKKEKVYCVTLLRH